MAAIARSASSVRPDSSYDHQAESTRSARPHPIMRSLSSPASPAIWSRRVDRTLGGSGLSSRLLRRKAAASYSGSPTMPLGSIASQGSRSAESML